MKSARHAVNQKRRTTSTTNTKKERTTARNAKGLVEKHNDETLVDEPETNDNVEEIPNEDGG